MPILLTGRALAKALKMSPDGFFQMRSRNYEFLVTPFFLEDESGTRVPVWLKEDVARIQAARKKYVKRGRPRAGA